MEDVKSFSAMFGLTGASGSSGVAVVPNNGDQFGTARCVEFAKDSVQVGFDRVFAYAKLIAYLFIAVALHY